MKFLAGFVWGVNVILTILFRKRLEFVLRNIANWIGDFIYGIFITFLPGGCNAGDEEVPDMRDENGAVRESGKVDMPETGNASGDAAPEGSNAESE